MDHYDTEQYERAMLFDQPVLFIDERLPKKEIPTGMYAYDLRGSDYDFCRPVTLEKQVYVNHAGTILTAQPISIPESGKVDVKDKIVFDEERCTIREYEISIYPDRMTEPERLAAGPNANVQKLFEFLNNPDDAYIIYQLKFEQATAKLLFQSIRKLQEAGIQVERCNYNAVYTGSLPSGWKRRSDSLNKLYYEFNMRHPSDFQGHSMSVSDVVGLKINGKVTTHYVDSVGFRELKDFLPLENHLKNAEMVMEDDYGMIDGIINNGKSAALQENRERPSVTDQLKQPGRPSHKESRSKPDERSL
jgi:hypothetical protein